MSRVRQDGLERRNGTYLKREIKFRGLDVDEDEEQLNIRSRIFNQYWSYFIIQIYQF